MMRAAWLAVMVLLAPLMAQAEPMSAQETIRTFYMRYLNDYPMLRTKENSPPMTRSLRKQMDANAKICLANTGIEQCEWDSDFDPFLDAQEYKANYMTSGIVITEPEAGLVQVVLNVYPAEVTHPEEHIHTIRYRMVQAGDSWAVDDIFYENGRSARQLIRERNARYASPES